MTAEKSGSISSENSARTTETPSPADTNKVQVTPKKVQEDIEIGGPSGPEPTRYGDWEKGGRCTDF